MIRHEALWVTTTREGPSFPSLDRHVDIDVAVIGAGIAGLTTALLCKREGLSVAVLEAGKVAMSTSGQTTAKVTVQHGLIYDELQSKFGAEPARLYAKGNQAALRTMESLIEELRIECDWEHRPAFTYTDEPDRLAAIEREVAAARDCGVAAHFVTETDLPWQVQGAIRVDEQAQFHPRRYCLALAEQIDGEGCVVFERTRAVDVEEGSPCAVKTDRHDLSADRVVIATHLPFLDRGGFFAKCHPEREYVLALGLEEPAPQGVYISADQPTRSIRQHSGPEGELLILAGESHRTGQEPDTEARYEALTGFAQERFSVQSVAQRWSTQDYMSLDRVPFIGPLQARSERLFVATGFNKWGMTNGTLAGSLICDQLLGRENPWAGFFDPHRVKPLSSAKRFVKENANVAGALVGGHLARKPQALDAELGVGEGRIMSAAGSPIAVSRVRDGGVRAVSARCTHMGCVVKWNGAEQSWDCPCHGSRFACDGAVLDGPAVKPLSDRSDEVTATQLGIAEPQIGAGGRSDMPNC